MDLEYRLRKLVDILELSNEKISKQINSGLFNNSTGFEEMYPCKLKDAAIDLYSLNIQKGSISIDLGCGNGGWALFAASLGYRSYGIDINQILIDEAKLNLKVAKKKGIISENIICEFAQGNIYSGRWSNIYNHERRNRISNYTMPYYENIYDPYKLLGISLKDADVIYSYPWKDQMNLLMSFLYEESSDAVYLLPHHPSSIYFEKNKQTFIKELEYDGTYLRNPFFIGKRMNLSQSKIFDHFKK